MATDVKLDQGDGSWLLLEAAAVKVAGADLMLDATARRRGGGPLRRALVHDQGDGLTLNFGGDYPGGVTVTGSLRVTGDVRLGGGEGTSVAALQQAVATLESTVASQLAGVRDRLDALQATVASLVQHVGAAIVPAWRTRTEVEEGDDMGLVSPPAAALGLVVEYVVDQRNPAYDHEDVISISPAPGTVVARGSTVVVHINLEG